jgi:hypothetical protein
VYARGAAPPEAGVDTVNGTVAVTMGRLEVRFPTTKVGSICRVRLEFATPPAESVTRTVTAALPDAFGVQARVEEFALEQPAGKFP